VAISILPFSFSPNFYSEIAKNTNKKSSLYFRQAAIFRKSNKLCMANNRTPAGFYPAGHHQLTMFLQLICLITITLNQVQPILSSKKLKNIGMFLGHPKEHSHYC